MDNKYNNGKIYILTTDKSNLIYVGCTILTLHKKMIDFKTKFKNNKLDYTAKEIFEIGGNINISLIKSYPCNSLKELNAGKNRYILGCYGNNANKYIFNRPKEELDKMREFYNRNQKEYYKANKKEIQDKRAWSKTWGGDSRYNNNLKCIKMDLFK